MPTEKKPEDIKSQQRFDEQCFLLDNYNKFTSHNIKETKGAKNYKNFAMITGEPSTVVHTLVAKRGIDELFQMSPAQVNLLVPKIRLYKVSYKEKNKVGTSKELIFNDHTSPKTIENITRNKLGRGDDVGLKEFSYELAGTNPAEGGIASCNLVVFFNDVGVLVRQQETKKTARFLDLIVPEVELKKKEDAYNSNKLIEEWNPRYFRLKVDVGWAIPSDPGGVLIGKKLRKAIEKSSTTLFLTLRDHDLEFDEKGSLKMNVTYQGAMEGALNDAKSDILAISEQLSKDIKFAEKKVSENRKKKAELAKKVKANAKLKAFKAGQEVARSGNVFSWISRWAGVDKSVEDGLNKAAEKIKGKTEAEVKVDALKATDKQIRYSRILSAMQDASRMYYTDVSKEIVEGFSEGQRAQIEKLKEASTKDNPTAWYNDEITSGDAKFLQAYYRRQVAKQSGIKIVRVGKEDRKVLQTNRALEGVAKVAGIPGGTDKKKNKDKVNKVIGETTSHLNAWTPKDSPDKRRVYFFYFGDLIDIIFSVLAEEGRGENYNLRTLLGPITLVDSLNPKNISSCNLADIPISLNLFLAWYLDKVVAQQRERYYLGSFIKDVISELIGPALGENCFLGKNEQKVNVAMSMFSAPASAGKAPIPLTGRINATSIGKNTGTTVDQKNTFSETSGKNELFHYLFIYVSNWTPKHLRASKKDDLARGIYHLFTGADRGLVKSVSFNKIDQPYVGEMRATQDTEGVKRVRGQYNAKVVMVGNNLFSPGVYIYIDTSKMGLGLPHGSNSIAQKLGIGGYYQIKTINHLTNANNYETELDCQWISAGETADKKTSKGAGEKLSADERYKKLVGRLNQISKENK